MKIKLRCPALYLLKRNCRSQKSRTMKSLYSSSVLFLVRTQCPDKKDRTKKTTLKVVFFVRSFSSAHCVAAQMSKLTNQSKVLQLNCAEAEELS